MKYGLLNCRSKVQYKKDECFVILLPGKLFLFKDPEIAGKHVQHVSSLCGAIVRLLHGKTEFQILVPNSMSLTFLPVGNEEMTSWAVALERSIHTIQSVQYSGENVQQSESLIPCHPFKNGQHNTNDNDDPGHSKINSLHQRISDSQCTVEEQCKCRSDANSEISQQYPKILEGRDGLGHATVKSHWRDSGSEFTDNGPPAVDHSFGSESGDAAQNTIEHAEKDADGEWKLKESQCDYSDYAPRDTSDKDQDNARISESKRRSMPLQCLDYAIEEMTTAVEHLEYLKHSSNPLWSGDYEDSYPKQSGQSLLKKESNHTSDIDGQKCNENNMCMCSAMETPMKTPTSNPERGNLRNYWPRSDECPARLEARPIHDKGKTRGISREVQKDQSNFSSETKSNFCSETTSYNSSSDSLKYSRGNSRVSQRDSSSKSSVSRDVQNMNNEYWGYPNDLTSSSRFLVYDSRIMSTDCRYNPMYEEKCNSSDIQNDWRAIERDPWSSDDIQYNARNFPNGTIMGTKDVQKVASTSNQGNANEQYDIPCFARMVPPSIPVEHTSGIASCTKVDSFLAVNELNDYNGDQRNVYVDGPTDAGDVKCGWHLDNKIILNVQDSERPVWMDARNLPSEMVGESRVLCDERRDTSSSRGQHREVYENLFVENYPMAMPSTQGSGVTQGRQSIVYSHSSNLSTPKDGDLDEPGNVLQRKNCTNSIIANLPLLGDSQRPRSFLRSQQPLNDMAGIERDSMDDRLAENYELQLGSDNMETLAKERYHRKLSEFRLGSTDFSGNMVTMEKQHA